MSWDTDPAAEEEARLLERMDTDMLQAELTRAGNAIHRARKAGICAHQGAAGYLPEPVYPEQQGLRPGQLRCTDHTGGCQRVFESDEDWLQAMADAVADYY